MPLEWILFIVGLTILFFIIYTCPTWAHSYGNKNIVLYCIVLYIHIPTSRLTLIIKAYTMCINWRKTNKNHPKLQYTFTKIYSIQYTVPFKSLKQCARCMYRRYQINIKKNSMQQAVRFDASKILFKFFWHALCVILHLDYV